jgi:hypothetical protein
VRTVRIGCGAGYAGDRIEPAVELAERGRLAYLVFECLAERTIALAQQARAQTPTAGFDPLLAERMRRVLPACHMHGIRIVTNMGAANPLGAVDVVRQVARDLGLSGLTIAAVTGDDVLDEIRRGRYAIQETGEPVESLGDTLLSASAYVGAAPIVQALQDKADVVITGRVADPSLFLGPLVHEFGWAFDDWPRLGGGTAIGHLLECAGQVTGGYFAEPGLKDVPALARLGFPLAEAHEDGTAVITKVAGSGGLVTVATCAEQLLYEIHDPSAYRTPDVVADFSQVALVQDGPDRVRVSGASGATRPDELKVTLVHRDGFIGEGQISYAGEGAEARGRLALGIVSERLALRGIPADNVRLNLIGVDAMHGPTRSSERRTPYEVRVRVAGRTRVAADAERIANEVETLYTNGPAGGAGVSGSVREVLAVKTAFVPRDRVQCRVKVERVP